MANIAIFRKAKANQISTLSHLINNHELTNQDSKLNPSKDNINTVYIYDNGLKTAEFKRDGTNAKIIEKISEIEKRLDQEARADYTEYKTKEKLANPNKKIRTVLQSKNLKKEFIIAVGGDCKIDDPVQFEKDVLKTAFKILKHKGLDEKNLIALVVHNDESSSSSSNSSKSSPSQHIHCQYCDYSWSKKTTATQLEKPKITNGMTPEEKRQAHKSSREAFALFQNLTAEGLKMSRGEKDSRVKHKTKAQFYEEKAKEVDQLEIKLSSKTQELEEIKKAVEDVRKSTSAEINALANSKKQFQAEYNTFEDNLKREFRGLIEIKNQIRINSNMLFLPTPEVNLDILIAGLNTELGLNWKLKDLEKTYIAGQYCLQKMSYPDLAKLIKNAEDLTKKINEKLERENVLARNPRTR